MKTKRVLILTANYGDGHLSVAKSLERGIHNKYPDVEVYVVNLFHEAHPVINEGIRSLYLKCYSKAPKIYDFLYYSTKDIKRNFYVNNVIGLFGKRTLTKYLDEIKPDLVINTFPVLAMPIMYKKGKTKVPCYTVITDYGLHSQWIDPGITKYFIGHENLIEQLMEQGVTQDKIEVTGIPVLIDNNILDKDEFLDKYDFKNREYPVVTLLAGANSVLNDLDKVVCDLYNIEPKANFIIACGKNKELREKIEGSAADFTDRIKVYGFVDNLHEIMRCSDLIISKAGGITTTEALNIGVPLIIYGYPAGQEKENTRFLVKNNCAVYTDSFDKLIDTLKNFLNDKDIIKTMSENTKRIRRPEGWSKIAEHIIELNEEYQAI